MSDLRLNTTPRLMVLAALVGVGAGLGAVVLIKSIELVSTLVDELQDLLGGSRAWVLLVLPAGVWLAWWSTDLFGPEAAGHGVPQIIAAIRVRASRIALRIAPLKVVATAMTIGVGGSAGREGPIAQIGAAIGSAVGRRFNLGESVTRSLIGAGTAAGISATFNAPIAGMLFSLEVVLGSFSAGHLSTVVIASLAGAIVSRSILGEALTFTVPAYPLSSPWELALYGVVALAATAGGYIFLRQLDWWERWPGRLPKALRPLLVAGVVAVLGVVSPEVLGTGQAFIGQLLRNEASIAVWTLLGVAVIKAVATAGTFGARGSGGIFMPSLFIGAAIGSALAQIIEPYWSVSSLDPGAFALVGMAAAFTAIARAPLTAVLIVFESTGDYGLVVPLMLATMMAMVLADRIHPINAYTMVLARLGVPLKQLEETDLLEQIQVAEVLSPVVLTLDPETTLAVAQGELDRHALNGAPVLEEDRLVGILTGSDIRAFGGPSDQVTVGEAMTRDPVTITSDMSVSDAMQRMSGLGVGRLPVVGSDASELLGLFRREDAVRAYHRAVDAATYRRLAVARQQVTLAAGASFFEFDVPEGSRAAGKPVSEIPWPEGCLVVALQRGGLVLVASGATQIEVGDRLTCFGAPGVEDRLRGRLGAPPRDD